MKSNSKKKGKKLNAKKFNNAREPEITQSSSTNQQFNKTLNKSAENAQMKPKSSDAQLKPNVSFLLNLLSQRSKLAEDSSTSSRLGEMGIAELKELLQTRSKTQNFESILKENDGASDEEEEFVEYVFRPRQYFLCSICQLCKTSLTNGVPCRMCNMTNYCSENHMQQDHQAHRGFCAVLSEIARSRGGHILNNSKHMDSNQFRSHRVGIIGKCEQLLNRQLLPFEKEIVLFPRICANGNCRQWRQELLKDCSKCGQVAYCKAYNSHLDMSHSTWCKPFKLLQEIVILQNKYGGIDTILPSKILKQNLYKMGTIDDIFRELYHSTEELENECIYATATQTASAPLTVLYGSYLSNLISKPKLTVHIIGAELQFECDALRKWEAFFLHACPIIKDLVICFVGPELLSDQISVEELLKIRLCKDCRFEKRSINYTFENCLYHEYVLKNTFQKPDLVCFFNPGLHRTTGFNLLDSWPDTIKATAFLKCPIIVTSYTQFESPLDLRRYINEAQRPVEIVMPPTVNPFRSRRPERNFISEEIVPIIFKNYYIFILQ